MKIVLPIAAIVIAAFVTVQPVADPLTNTKWAGSNGLIVHFTKSDTVKLMMNDQLITSAQYKVKDTLLIWRDIVIAPGNCDTSIRGTYRYKINEDVLNFRTISDRCEDRANILQTLVLIKQ